jgi:hypothetical protein
MKRYRLTWLFGFLFILMSCSSVKLVDESFEIEDHSLKSKTVLVVAKSDDPEVRKAYEDLLIEKIARRGFTGVAAYEEFPDLSEQPGKTLEERQRVVENFKSAGIQAVLVMALKNTRVEEPDIDREPKTMQVSANQRSYVSFAEYYNVNSTEFLSSSLRPSDREEELPAGENLYKTTVYELEAVVYDLELPLGSQLAGVYEVEATDPKSADQVLQKFTSIISKQLH